MTQEMLKNLEDALAALLQQQRDIEVAVRRQEGAVLLARELLVQQQAKQREQGEPEPQQGPARAYGDGEQGE